MSLATTVAVCISIIAGIIVSHLINTKFTTDEHVGNFIGIAVTLGLIWFFFSIKGQAFIKWVIRFFPIKLKYFNL